jgi:hypothetical protein
MAIIMLLLAVSSAASAGVNPISANTLPLLFSKGILAMFGLPYLM